MADGFVPSPKTPDPDRRPEVALEDAPAGFRLRDLNIATSLGQLTVSLFRQRSATASRQAAATPQATPHGRLIFAMDATGSREDSWDQACHIQAEMFDAVSELGSLDVQLVHFRGLCGFSASPWYHDAEALRKRMTGVSCQSGQTQLRRVLSHAIKETRQRRVAGVIFVGDAVEEADGPLRDLAGELGMLGTPVFVFHEPAAEDENALQTEVVLRDIARLSGGAYCPFDPASPAQLRNLLRAVAVFAVGGRLALPDLRPKKGVAAERPLADVVGVLYQQMGWRRGA